MTDGQLSIFDVLESDASLTITCHYCHFAWEDTSGCGLKGHIDGSGHWPYGGSIAGKCENQKIYLYRVGAQHHFGLRLRDDEPTTTYKNDLLGVILEAKQRGCTDKQIQKVLTKTRK
ncbi:hypothetical protein [Brevibacterium antiquum]|uniref:Uncharacterized protein n=1 Tax=Brevibacterium antiquum TaxID=234835 RepID=A0A2H1IMU9_9MICO|nr:hypothetical protein [Brevibacterium antiquum]SMX76545.1 hypothetical protein BANT10_01105 [Brevibacterium antiquum]